MRLIRPGLLVILLPLFMVSPAPADELPDGRLDYGMDFDIPPAVRVNRTTPRTVEMLQQAMAGAQPSRRAQLITEIGRCQLPQSAEPVRQALRDEHPLVRSAAAGAAAELGQADLRDDLLPLLRDDDPQVRRSAVLAFGRIDAGATRPTPALVQGLADEQPVVRSAAIQIAASEEDAQLLLDQLADLPPQLRAQAFGALGRLEFTDAADTIARSLDAELPLRSAAIEALGNLGARQHARTILNDLQHRHPTVRRQVVRALHGLVDPAEQQSIAMQMIADPDPSVRQAAAEVLGRLPLPEAIALLVRQLDDPYAPLHHAAREALLADGGEAYREGVIAAAVPLLEHSNLRRREDASYLLGNLRSNAGMEQHLALLAIPDDQFTQNDWRVLQQAAYSLGRIADPRATEPVGARISLWRLQGIPVSADPAHGYVVDAASEVLIAAARLGYQPAVEEYAEVLRGNPQFQPAGFRAAALWGTGVLAPASGGFTSRCFGVVVGEYEGHISRFEAIKALGNQRAPGAAAGLAGIRDEMSDPDLRWVAHWAHQRVTGESTPYTPPDHFWTADVSILDLTPRTRP